jgi:hypothetical protein
MDETTRMILAYIILALGFPMLAAKIIWFVPGAISTKMLAQVASRLDQFTDEAIEGFISVQLACLVFEQMGIQLVWKVPFTLIVVTSMWNWAKDNTFKIWPAMAGILSGFVFYPKVSLFLSFPPSHHLWT